MIFKNKKQFSLVYIIIISIYLTGCVNTNTKDTVVINTKHSYSKIQKKDTEPIFSFSEIPEKIKTKMIGKSMPENMPISFDKLSYLKLTYYDFEKNVQVGEMIVNKNIANDVVDIFKELFVKKYPIEKINLIDEYDADDKKSMTDNNSSSFCYRTISGTNIVSNHGMGLAIDINPLQNPHVVNNVTNPIESSNFVDRSVNKLGMIVENDDAYKAFSSRGWSWGGHWKNPDYQHFEKIN